LIVILLSVAFLLSFTLVTQAAEVQLGGIRLDESVVGLLTHPGWGLPAGIGLNPRLEFS
jgi:hypothetical protein